MTVPVIVIACRAVWGVCLGVSLALLLTRSAFLTDRCILALSDAKQNTKRSAKPKKWHYVKRDGYPDKKGLYLICRHNGEIAADEILIDEKGKPYTRSGLTIDGFILAWKEIIPPEEVKEICGIYRKN